MRIGDMVEYAGAPEESNDRRCGIVTGLDIYNGVGSRSIGGEGIVEVLWNTGHSWILAARVRVIYENR